MKKITWNSPVVLSFALLSALTLVLNTATGGWTNLHLFSVYRSSLADPLFYIRLFGHVLGHADFSHYLNNMLIFLLVGPMLEEKYGSKRMIEMIAFTAVITGIVNIIIAPNTRLLGASGVVFAMILLSSITGTKSKDGIPLTLIVVAVLYISQEVYQGFTSADNISQLTHIVGGIVGCVYGMVMRPSR